jgi:hypothetical protein
MTNARGGVMQKNTLRILTLASLLAASLLAPRGAHAQAPPSTVPLLWAHARQTFPFLGGQFADTDLVITADGVSHATVMTSQGLDSTGWSSVRSVFRATAAQLASLKEAIGAAQLGIQPGGCQLESAVPTEATYELVWYGRGTRSNAITMTASPTSSAALCPPALLALVSLLQMYGGAALGAD